MSETAFNTYDYAMLTLPGSTPVAVRVMGVTVMGDPVKVVYEADIMIDGAPRGERLRNVDSAWLSAMIN